LKQYHLSKTGGKWAVHEMSLGDGKWTDEIVAVDTTFKIQADAKYTDLDKSRLLRDFMAFVLRVSAQAMWLIVSTQFPQSYLQKFEGFYSFCYHREDFERFGAVPGVYGHITPKLAFQVGRCPLRCDATSSTMENPSPDHPRPFHLYSRQWFWCLMPY
jgi:hypothetical protein